MRHNLYKAHTLKGKNPINRAALSAMVFFVVTDIKGSLTSAERG